MLRIKSFFYRWTYKTLIQSSSVTTQQLDL